MIAIDSRQTKRADRTCAVRSASRETTSMSANENILIRSRTILKQSNAIFNNSGSTLTGP